MGGNAVAGVGAIHITEVGPTLRRIEQQLGLPCNYLDDRLLGSVGKKEYSGDIDIVMNVVDAKAMKEFSDTVRKIYGQFNVKRSGNMFNIAVPIEQFDNTLLYSAPRTGTVQVDFVFADHAYTKFFYHSAGNDSAYKGVHRNLAISAIAGYTDRCDSDELDDMGRSVEIIRWKFGINGFVKIRRYSRKDKNDKWIKSQKDENIGIPKTDPLLIAEILLGDGADVSDLDSLETIIAACKRFFTKEKQDLIFERIAFNINDYNNRSIKTSLVAYGVPDEIASFMDKL